MAHTANVEDIKKHVRVYMIVFGSLAVLTIVTVAVGIMELPIIPALVIGLLIATVKGGLVGGYFMHLVSEKKMIYWVVFLTIAFFIGMVILFLAAYYGQFGTHLVA
jgi:caa(3)-type oxidase subunit IV